MKRAGLAIPLLLLLTACGNLVARTATATATAVAPAAPAATHSTQLTGTQLAAALVPGSAFPRGYRYDNSNSFNSGNRLETGPAKYPLASVSCFDFGNNLGQPGFGETAMAGNDYSTFVYQTNPTSDNEYDQAVYQFTSTSAARTWWRALHSALVRCPGFGALQPGAVGSQRFSAVQMPGAQAFRLDFTFIIQIPQGPTAELRVKAWVAVSGQDVFEVATLGDHPFPANPAPETVLRALIARVLAA